MPNRVIHSDPEILSGAPVFIGTRVPAQSLFEYLEGGELRSAARLSRLECADVRTSLSPANAEGISAEEQHDEQ